MNIRPSPLDTRDITDEITVESVDLQLFVCTEILKLRSLHFGYWSPLETPTWGRLAAAQQRYTEELLRAVPPGVARVLDVGCGIGDNARAFAAAGYEVTAISPDRNHARFFPPGNCVRFHNSRFEEFRSEERFDLVLMSESQNYFDAAEGLERSARLLHVNGHLLVCGMFRREGTSRFGQTRTEEREYLELSRRQGFRVLTLEDITPNVLPTVVLADQMYRAYAEPCMEAVALYGRTTRSWRSRLLQLILRPEVRRLRRIHAYYEDFFDPRLFQENLRYMTLLFRLEATGADDAAPV